MVQIPKVSFNTFQAQPQSSGASFNPLQSVGDALGGVAQAVQTNERNAIIQQKELAAIQQKRDKRDADAFMNQVAVDSLISDTENRQAALEGSDNFQSQWPTYEKYTNEFYQAAIKAAPNQQAVDRLENEKIAFMKKAYTEMNKASVTQNINRRKTQIENANNDLVGLAYQPEYPLDELLNINDSNYENAVDTLGFDEAEEKRVKGRTKIVQERIRHFETENNLEGLSIIRENYADDLTNADKAKIDSKLKNEFDRQEKLAKEKPADYVLEMAQKQGGVYDVDAAVDIQKKQKVRPEQYKVLADEHVKVFSQNLKDVDSPQEMQRWLEGVEEVVSPAYLPQAFRQLEEKGGIPRQYKGVMSFMPPTSDELPTALDEQALDYLFRYNRTLRNKGDFDNDFKDKMIANDDAPADFQKKLIDGIGSYLGVLENEGLDPTAATDVKETMKIIAQSHYMENGDMDAAVLFAQEAYAQDFHADVSSGGIMSSAGTSWPTVDGVALRIPKSQVSDPDIVVDYLEDWKENNAETLLTVTHRQDEEALKSIQSGIMKNSFFALNRANDGVILFNELGDTVQKDAAGKPIELKFKDINKGYKDMKKAQREAASERSKNYAIEQLKETEAGQKTLKNLGLK